MGEFWLLSSSEIAVMYAIQNSLESKIQLQTCLVPISHHATLHGVLVNHFELTADPLATLKIVSPMERYESVTERMDGSGIWEVWGLDDN